MGSPTKILTLQAFAPVLSKVLTIPHVLETIRDQTDAQIAEILLDTDVLVSPEFKPEWRSSKENRRLRLVHSSGAGVDGIDRASLPPGCKVCNVYGHEHALAETVFMDMLILQKNLFKLHSGLRKGDWSPELGNLLELRKRNLLVLGLGHAGAEIVRWGQFMDMNVTALTRSPSKERAAKAGLSTLGSLSELGSHLGWADFIVVAIPASKDTVDLIGEKEFNQMKSTAFLINVGRAKVVNEEVLYNALRTRRIAGAGLDVWYQYPEGDSDKAFPSRFPIHELENVVMTPHKPTVETMAYRWAKIAENVAKFSRGEPLENVVYTA
jgi:phosphoglycerate dehydrogenase-like enzyme